MFELLASWLLGPWSPPKDMPILRSTPLSEWLAQTPLPILMEPTYTPDPKAIAALNTYLNDLERSGLDLNQQGIWLQTNGQIWAAHQGETALPAASLTKLATSLAALATWGTEHRFETLISTTGRVTNGVLSGDLIVEGGGDPLYVWEEAIALANALQKLGIQHIEGDLYIAGAFSMNYEDSPIKSGNLLKQAFNAALWPPEATQQYGTMPPGTVKPSLSVGGSVRFTSKNALSLRQPRPLLRQYSLPLAQLLKLMNIYSNNVMSQTLADLMGGANRVAHIVAQMTHISPDEIQLINGSGLGTDNQISPRAVCRILIALHQQVEGTPWSLADLLPVSGRDVGTLEGRRIPTTAAVKTGSLWNVSALAGAFPTQEREVVWFTIINRGANLDGLRRQQDQLLNTLVRNWGSVALLPAPLQPGQESLKPENQLGASSRIQPLVSLE